MIEVSGVLPSGLAYRGWVGTSSITLVVHGVMYSWTLRGAGWVNLER